MSRSRLVLAALTAVAVGSISTTLLDAQEGRRHLTLEDYYRMESVGSPALSPDGDRVAWTRTVTLEEENRRHSEIWIAAADGRGEPRRLTSPSFSASRPRWSPDGSLLAFFSSRPVYGKEGRESASVWFLRVGDAAGEAFRIPGVEGRPLFSPDDRWIAFTREVPPGPDPVTAEESEVEPSPESDFERKILERFDGRMYEWMNYRFDRRGYLPDPRDPRATPPEELHVVPREGGEPRMLTELGFDVRSPAWRPDGGALAFVADSHQRDEHSYERADLWVVTLDGMVRRLTDDEMDYRSPAWSPDGESVAVRGNQGLDVVIRERWDHGAPVDLFLFPADAPGDGPRNLTADWDLIPGSPTWSPDGRHLYFSALTGGNAHLFRVPVSGGEVEQVTEGDRRLGGFSFSDDFGLMAFDATDPIRPGDIHVARTDGSGEARITDANAQLLADVELSPAERILYRSEDGTPIEGWVMPPAGYDPAYGSAPMILVIHGGPHGAYGNDFSFRRQLLAARGYFVLFTNPRASVGYGEEFRWGIWGGWGFRDFEDLMAGVDHALEHYPVDRGRLGVTGYSYGGFMTNWVIGHTDRFRAAISGASISNWLSDYGVADIPRTKESEFYGPPWEEESRELLLRSSPIIYAGNVTTPTLFVHGEADLRVPIEEAEQMYVALKKQKVPARFIRYPESYHGGWTPWRYVHRLHSELRWWEEWLGG